MVLTVKPVQLNPKTLEAFDAYIHNAETEMEQSLQGSRSFPLVSAGARASSAHRSGASGGTNFCLAKGRSKCRMV